MPHVPGMGCRAEMGRWLLVVAEEWVKNDQVTAYHFCFFYRKSYISGIARRIVKVGSDKGVKLLY